MGDESATVDIGQAAAEGAAAGIEIFFRNLWGQFQETGLGQDVAGGIDRYAFRRYLPWAIVGGFLIYFLAKRG